MSNRFAVLAGATALCLLGVAVIPGITVDILPDFKQPVVVSFFSYPGLPTMDMEKSVSSRVERSPAIATDMGDNIYVVWNDSTPGNYEICYKRCTNGDGTLTTKRLTWNGGASIVPAIATYLAGEIHIVWTDDSHGNEEIYYKKGIQ